MNGPYKALLLLILMPVAANAAEKAWHEYDHLYFLAGSYVHFNPSEEHDGSNIFVALEAIRKDNLLGGLALFDNSFGQFSQYLYVGKRWKLDHVFHGFRAKITAGLIDGYEDEHEDKIPFNQFGVAPAIIPGIGYDINKFGFEMILLGNSGMLFTLGYNF